MSARTRKDWILWGALGCALVGTAHAEYTLATAAHFHPWVAVVVPGALDLYVVRALQQRRDVFVAVLAMVAANVAAHLIQAGVLAVNWQVIAAVGAVAPLIVWRVYSLKYTRTRKELLWGLKPGAMSAPAPAPHSEPYPDEVQVHPVAPDWNEVARVRWVEMGLGAPDHVPADWMEEEYPETYPSAPAPCLLSEPFLRPLDDLCSECGGRWGDHPGVQNKRAAHLLKYPEYKDPSAEGINWDRVTDLASAPHLRSVPDLPAEYAPGAVHSESPLTESDLTFLPGAQEYVDQAGKSASVRGLKKALSIGQDRAERLLTHLGVIL